MLTKQKKHFHILDYFLDGQFVRWEEAEGNVPVCGQYWVVNLNDAQVVTRVLDIEPISETESKILLSSC
ncbi:hypothetical protein IQ255_03040 [Pleurocapsales cyanobacterium LEGE 10410]|nr:hypothetical protein [Pleurocapsales cyanobacterium LEGE 10410]